MPISIVIRRIRTPSVHIGYGLYFYFSGLSLRGTSQTLSSCFTKRNRVSIRNWIQKHKPRRLSSKKKKVGEFVVDETLFEIGSEFAWL
jgi:putative transposase